MKVLHIFGAVVAIHLAVFLVIFAVPGCRSTSKSNQVAKGDGEAPIAAGDSSPVSSAAAASDASTGTVANGGVTFSSGPTVRFSPTRPHTPAAGAVQSAPVSNVTPAATYTVKKNDSLWTVAKKHSVSVSELSAANNLRPNTPLHLGQKLIIPGKAAKAAAPVGGVNSFSTASVPPASAPGDSSAGPTHTVKGGETLAQIAKAHGTTIATLKTLNSLRTDTVRTGQTLSLPGGVSNPAETAPPAATTASSPSGGPTRGSGSFKHSVRSGETLGVIARKYQITVGELATANNIADPAKIRPGQELTIPGWSAPKNPNSSAPAPTTPATPTPPPTHTPPTIDPDAPLPSTESSTTAPAAPDIPVIRIEDSQPARTP